MIQFCSLFLSLAALASPLKVILDPGHGGRDHGAIAGSGSESRVTLDVAERLARLLRANPHFTVQLTRSGDQTVPLVARTNLANSARADLLLSIHVNSSPDPRAHGAEFYFRSLRAADEESAYLAHRENESAERADLNESFGPSELRGLRGETAAIVGDLIEGQRQLESSRLSKALKTKWSGPRKGDLNSVRQAPFFVLSQVDMASTLVELGFLTNVEDGKRLLSSDGRQAMARDLYRGLQAYRESFTTGNASRQP